VTSSEFSEMPGHTGDCEFPEPDKRFADKNGMVTVACTLGNCREQKEVPAPK
jgi:hypothetical protein